VSTEPEVDEFMAALEHPHKAGVQRLRVAILGADPGITEHIKWKAPSFVYGGEDRVTFKLHPPRRIELVFHRGVKVRADADEFAFDDPAGLLEWKSGDRAVAAFADGAEAAEREAELVELVRRWVRA